MDAKSAYISVDSVNHQGIDGSVVPILLTLVAMPIDVLSEVLLWEPATAEPMCFMRTLDLPPAEQVQMSSLLQELRNSKVGFTLAAAAASPEGDRREAILK